MSTTPPDAASAAAADAEAAAVRARYARREAGDPRYRLTNPAQLHAAQQRQRVLTALLRRHGHADLSRTTLLEVGSGGGGNLLELLWLGFEPANLCGIELLEARHATARERLPAALRLFQGDALQVDPGSAVPCDLVLASTVFSSILDDDVQQRLAGRIWSWLKPGGAVVWYDFAVDNPRNRDVRGVAAARLRALFPHARAEVHRVTLAPPLARATARWPALHGALQSVPFLRTHRLAWLARPAA